MAVARLVVLIVIICVVSISAQPSSRIWGGEEASKDDFPYVASVRLDSAHICGGSIIGDKYILTAAHCLVENGNTVSSNKLSVRVGSTNQFSGGKLVTISSVDLHPEYAGVKHDVAILTLDSALEWTDRINMIEFATSSTDEPTAGASVSVAGWGEQSDNVSSYKLHSITLSAATDAACTEAYSDHDSSTLCLAHALKEGSCTGDAGNGAVFNNKLVGVSSFVVGACGSRYPDVFANVSYYASWIQSILA